jgi:hypothetical protein
MGFQVHSTISPSDLREPVIDNNKPRQFSIWALLLRAIPLTTSFLLFILAISIDANRWGSRLLQLLIATAIFFGAIGIYLFLPKKY